MSGGSLKKLGAESNGISGTDGCCAKTAGVRMTRIAITHCFTVASLSRGRGGRLRGGSIAGKPHAAKERGAEVASAARLAGARQLLEQRLGLLDRQARIGDALPVDR